MIIDTLSSDRGQKSLPNFAFDGGKHETVTPLCDHHPLDIQTHLYQDFIKTSLGDSINLKLLLLSFHFFLVDNIILISLDFVTMANTVCRWSGTCSSSPHLFPDHIFVSFLWYYTLRERLSYYTEGSVQFVKFVKRLFPPVFVFIFVVKVKEILFSLFVCIKLLFPCCSFSEHLQSVELEMTLWWLTWRWRRWQTRWPTWWPTRKEKNIDIDINQAIRVHELHWY